MLKGDGAAGMGMTFDSLMARALDEPDALYGLVAQSVATSRGRADADATGCGPRRASTTDRG